MEAILPGAGGELSSRDGQVDGRDGNLQGLLNAVTVAMLTVDTELRVQLFNPAAGCLLKLGSTHVGMRVGQIHGDADTLELETRINAAIEAQEPTCTEVQDHACRWHTLNINPYRAADDRVAGAVVTLQDIDPYKRGLQALRDSEQRFRLFVESVRDYAMFQMDCNGRILSWNCGAERLLGWKEDEVLGKPADIIFTPEDVADGAERREFETAQRTGRAEDERWHMRKDGTRFYASGVLTRVDDDEGLVLGFAKVMRDVTERKEQEEQLLRSLAEKDTLVREIHHRVKNNLQVIVSLLSMQSRHTKDPQVLAAFEEAGTRLRAIAHIHERLYASDDLTEVEFGEYVTGLARELVALYSQSPDEIQLDLSVTDMVLHIEKAIPLGLIANELIMNSLKHGLHGQAGTIWLKLSYLPGSAPAGSGDVLDAGWAQLEIADSGPGLPTGLNLGQPKSMGLRLVNMLVRQVRGQVTVEKGCGARFTVSFPLENTAPSQIGAST